MLRALRARVAQPTSVSTLTSMLASGVAQSALLVSGICAARILGVQGRGQLALLNLIPLIISTVGALGVPVATTYFIARDRSNSRAVVDVAKRVGLAQAAVLLCIQGAILLLLYRSAPTSVKIAAASSLLLVPAKLGQDYGGCILQGYGYFGAFNIARATPNVLYSCAIFATFIIGGAHLLAVTICFVLAISAASVFTLTLTARRVAGRPVETEGPGATILIRFGLRALLGAYYPTEAFQLDQALVGALLTRTALGTYTVGVSFTNLPRLIAQSVGMVAYPHVAAISNETDARRSVWRFFWLGSAVSAAIVLILEAVTPALMPLLFGNSFRRSVEVTQILLIGAFIVSIRRVLADGMRGAGYPTLGSIAEAAGLLILLPALVVLIPIGGLEGAAWAVPIAAAGGFTVLLIGIAVTRRGPSERLRPPSGELDPQAGLSVSRER